MQTDTSREMHPKTLDPVIDEIYRVFKILQNEDGSWGKEESKFARAFTTSWVLKALSKQKEDEVISRGIQYFKDILESIKYNPTEHLGEVGELFAKGFFNAAEVLLCSSSINLIYLKKAFSSLLDKLKETNWLGSTTLAAYVVFGLRGTKIGFHHQEYARQFLEKELRHTPASLATVSPDICLAIPEVLKGFLADSEGFLKQIRNMPDIKTVHIMIALAELNRESNAAFIKSIRNQILESFRKRQITEIDRKITKTLLDLTLLLKSGQSGPSLAKKIKDFSPLIEVRAESVKEISFKIDLSKFSEEFGQLDLNTLASYAWAVFTLNQEHVYLLSENEYNCVKEFFVKKTVAVSRTRELINEGTGVLILVLTYFLSLIGLTVLVGNVTQNISVLKGNDFAIASLIASFIFGSALYKLKLIQKFFPFLYEIVKAKITRG